MKTIVRIDTGHIGYIDGYVMQSNIAFAVVVVPNIDKITLRSFRELTILPITDQNKYNKLFFG